MSEKKKTLLSKMGSADPNSMFAKMSSGLGADFLEGVLKKLEPYIDPMLEGIAEALGEDETLCILRKNKKDGQLYVYVVDVSKITAFDLEEGGMKQVIHGSDFITKMLSGDIKFE